MDSPRKTSVEKLKGGAQMRTLVLTTLAALERAGWAEATQLLHERVFSRNAETLAEPYDDHDVRRWRFKPMAELLLLELIYLAGLTHLSPAERRKRLEWTVKAAGF